MPFVVAGGLPSRQPLAGWNGRFFHSDHMTFAYYEIYPELNHNAVVGFPHPSLRSEALTVVLLRSDRDNPRHKIRFDVTRELLDRASIQHKSLEFGGTNMLSEVLQMTLFTDYVSFYVALLNGADPSPNTAIDYLKDRLAKG